MRPLSVCSETRMRTSFFRTTPARKPRTECCCHSVTVTRDAIVAPADVRSIAMIRSCLVADRAGDLDDAGADRWGDAGLAVFRTIERVAAFGLDLGLVMGSSRSGRRHPPHHLSPAQASTRQGRPPKRASAASSHPQQRSVWAGKPVNSEQKVADFLSRFDPENAAPQEARQRILIHHAEVRILPPQPASPAVGEPVASTRRKARQWRAFSIWWTVSIDGST